MSNRFWRPGRSRRSLSSLILDRLRPVTVGVAALYGSALLYILARGCGA